jgi:hypothetical protein
LATQATTAMPRSVAIASKLAPTEALRGDACAGWLAPALVRRASARGYAEYRARHPSPRMLHT